MTHVHRQVILFIFAVTPLGAVSCGSAEVAPPLAAYPVAGQVLYLGNPAPLARVNFYPVGGSEEFQKVVPTAQTGPKGRFHLSTFGLQDGAPAGEYRVTVVWHGPDPGTDLQAINIDEMSYMPNRLDEKFANPNTTPLTAKINEGDNKLEAFHVE